MSKFGMHNQFIAVSGKESELEQALVEASKLVQQLPGNLLYMVSRSEGRIAITEAWDSRESHQASLQDPSVRGLIGSAMPLIDGKPTYQHLEIVEGI